VTTDKLTGIALVAAVVLLAVWISALAWMGINRSLPDDEWARLLTLLHSLEAVVFAAAGALFGTTVQKERVQAAEDHAASAEQRARAKESEAANGRALASAVKAHRAPRFDVKPAGGIATTEAAPDPLVALAEKLFP